MKKDLYIVSKFIMASSAKEALELERKTEVSEIYLDGDWRKTKVEKMMDESKNVGF